LESAANSRKRFVVLALPTGVGKSAVYMKAAHDAGGRLVVMTATKGLQDQLEADFGATGLLDVRGMANYPCRLLGEQGYKGRSCADGPCRDGESCKWRREGCGYFDRLSLAVASDLIVTNYACWMAQKRWRGETGGLGPADVMVLDEAHEAADQVSDFMRVELRDTEAARPGFDGAAVGAAASIAEWREHAASWMLPRARAKLEGLTGLERRRQRDLVQQLETLADCGDDWIPWRGPGRWCFEPRWPTEHAWRWLWGRDDDDEAAQRVVLSSATLQRKQLAYLGIGEGDYDWIEAPSPFPVGRRPIYQLDTAWMRRGISEDKMAWWAARHDQVIGRRLDRKGIVLTVSYDRAQELVDRSRYADIMITHDSKTTADAVEAYRRAKPPAILVSPSVDTGYDFPGDQCRYVVVSKVPFPSIKDPVTKARTEDDPEYPLALAVQRLEQGTGRGMRSMDDWCETVILDDTVKMLVGKHKKLFHRWWLDAYRHVEGVPEPIRLPSTDR
jgi:Rad3-related DNA helicase